MTNELTIALRRRHLVAVYLAESARNTLLSWANSTTSPFRPLPAEVLSGTFDGDGKGLWLRGVHRRRSTKADSKALNGERLQDAVDALEDAKPASTACTR